MFKQTSRGCWAQNSHSQEQRACSESLEIIWLPADRCIVYLIGLWKFFYFKWILIGGLDKNLSDLSVAATKPLAQSAANLYELSISATRGLSGLSFPYWSHSHVLVWFSQHPSLCPVLVGRVARPCEKWKEDFPAEKESWIWISFGSGELVFYVPLIIFPLTACLHLHIFLFR